MICLIRVHTIFCFDISLLYLIYKWQNRWRMCLTISGEWARPWVANGPWKLVNFRWRKGLCGKCSRSPLSRACFSNRFFIMAILGERWGGSTRRGESTTTLKPYSLFITLNSFRLWHNISLINCFMFTLKQFATIHYQKTIRDWKRGYQNSNFCH